MEMWTSFFKDENGKSRRVCKRINVINSKAKTYTLPNMYRIDLMDREEVFPNVEVLIIPPNVKDIRIRNEMFPNVKYVESESKDFFSDSLLVKGSGNKDLSLLNTFCKQPGEEINLSGITTICDNAFSGCKSTNVTCTKDVAGIIGEHVFHNSEINHIPFQDGMRIIGTILVDIADNVREVHIPSYITAIDYSRVKLQNLDRVIIDNDLIIMSTDTRQVQFPKTVVLSKDFGNTQSYIKCSPNSVFCCDYRFWPNNAFMNVDRIEVDKDNEKYMSVDGILYSEHMLALIKCPGTRSGKMIIPNNVTEIGCGAFRETKITEVILPDSLKLIENNAFYKCENLEHIEFGNGIKEIEGYSAFAECKNLKHLTLPKQMRRIRNGVFSYSGLESVQLNDGLEYLSSHVFYHCENLKTITIPSSLQVLGTANLTYVQDIHISEKIKPPVLFQVFYSAVNLDMHAKMPQIVKITQGEKVAYVAKKTCETEKANNLCMQDIISFMQDNKEDIFDVILEQRQDVLQDFFSVLTISKEDTEFIEHVINKENPIATAYLMEKVKTMAKDDFRI